MMFSGYINHERSIYYMNETNTYEVIERALIDRDCERILTINNNFCWDSFSLANLEELRAKIKAKQANSGEMSVNFLNATALLSRQISKEIKTRNKEDKKALVYSVVSLLIPFIVPIMGATALYIMSKLGT